jgi:translocation and assembly module TamA
MPRTAPLLRIIRRALLIAALTAATPIAYAADPQPYTVTITPTNEPLLDSALHDSASLISLNTKAPVGPFALITRARDDQARLKDALNSFGHYEGTVAITILGKPLDDPSLPDALDAEKSSVEVKLDVTPGPTYHLRNLTLAGPGSDDARKSLQLKSGDAALAATVLAAGPRMETALQDSGHALATVSAPNATLVPADKALDVAWTVDAGPQVNLGPIAIDGLKKVDASYVRQRLTIHQGEQYDPAKIEAARQDLAAQGVFSSVRATAGKQLDHQGQMPITIDVVEAPRHVVAFTGSYSTDLGASAGVTFTHRNLFGGAEKLVLGAAITQLGGSASTGQGYNVNAALTKPDVFTRDQSVTVSLQAIKESLQAYNRTAILAGVQVNRKLTDTLTATAGLQAQQSHITQEGVTRDYTLLGLPLGLKYDSTGPGGLFDPTHGIKANLIATPTESLAHAAGSAPFFTILQLTASTYLDPGAWLGATPGRSIIALRGIAGSIQGASTFQVPPDERFYAGGSATVRGYKYQSVGPRFAADLNPTGGTSLAAATIEYRQRILDSFGAVVFVDTGEVGTASSPFGGQLRTGAGVGARYYTPIGPIRLDVALPLNKQRGDDAFELYIGIGQAF